MKKILIVAAVASATLAMSMPASAFQQITHKRIAIDAINYMKAHPDTTNYAPLAAAAAAAGYTIEQFAETVGQGAYDVDDFKDTYICGAITGDCVSSPVFEAGASLAAYTSYWHFQNHTRGGDAHGNDLGGYNYDLLTVWGSVDTLAATWLTNDHLDDGAGGMTGQCYWFLGCSEDSEYNSYGITEANYRQGSSSNKGMYEDFQNIPFQPIDNLGNYWYSQFLNNPTAQTLGFTLHTTDLLQPHHTWTTSDLNHSGWESWVTDYYDSEQLNADAKVTAALADFTPIATDSSDIRPLLTEGGAISYSQGGAVLNTTDHSARLTVANVVVPHAIAMAVHLFNHAADKMVSEVEDNHQVNGNWASSGGKSATASGNPHYTLNVSSAANVTIDLTSSTDTYLYLLDSTGSVIASNDDGGDGYNSRITANLQGSYEVVAATYSNGKSGSFQLNVTSGDLTAK